jgi:dCMP deaminase
MNFDWSDLAFASKKPVNQLRATFIAAPRELSALRFTELVKLYLPKANIVLGLAKEPFVLGLENQPQFKMLEAANVQRIIDKVNLSPSEHKIYTLSYFQRELNYLLEKLKFSRVVFIRGSWKYAFHTQPPYYTLVNRGIAYELVSPFVDESEAKAYEKHITQQIPPFQGASLEKMGEEEMMAAASAAANYSFDYCFQVGASLGRPKNKGYQLLAQTYNKVVPYQTFAMHFGASREINFSPPHDLNHYDTVHAEVEMILKAGKEHIDLKGTTLFINLLPCPMCSRMFAETGIAEFVYRQDHSNGYAIRMLEAAGKKVRRIVV